MVASNKDLSLRELEIIVTDNHIFEAEYYINLDYEVNGAGLLYFAA